MIGYLFQGYRVGTISTRCRCSGLLSTLGPEGATSLNLWKKRDGRQKMV